MNFIATPQGMCVDTISSICDDFTTYNWQPNGDTLGYTQGGIYPVINVPYDTNSTLGSWGYNLSPSNPGMYGVTAGAKLSFNGNNQTIMYEIYGFYNQFSQMKFSVNGSSALALNGNFPVTIAGVTVNLDTSATNFFNWENVYLSFSGNVNEIKIYAFESGIKQMCVDTANVTAISEINDPYNLNVYPNPATNNLTIDNKSNTGQKFTLSLMNIQGQTIVNEYVNFKTTHTIDVSGLSNGVYILSLQNGNTNYIRRVVIQN